MRNCTKMNALRPGWALLALGAALLGAALALGMGAVPA